MKVYSDLKDPSLKGHDLLSVGRQHTGLRPVSRTVPPATYYRVGSKTQRLKCMVTIMPDGLHVAWDFCGTCSLGLGGCTCYHGPTAPPYIEKMYGPYTKGKDVPPPEKKQKTLRAEKSLRKPEPEAVQPTPGKSLRRTPTPAPLPKELTRKTLRKPDLARPPSMTEVNHAAAAMADDALDLALRRTKQVAARQQRRGGPKPLKPRRAGGDSPQCPARHDTEEYPGWARCVWPPNHGVGHEDRHGNTWHAVVKEEPAGPPVRKSLHARGK